MDIWTERLVRRHLPLLECWVRRREGAMTPNDLPREAEKLAAWYEACSADPGRLDCLVSVYETPVGLSGLRQHSGQSDTAELHLLLCELSYNPLRTATYTTLRMLDHAFLELGFNRAAVQIYAKHGWYLNVLEQMGFTRTIELDGLISLSVEKSVYLDRKYLF